MSSKLASEPNYKPGTVTTANTIWVFVAGANEARHIHDIAFASWVLLQKGVAAENIAVFTDFPAAHQFLGPYGLSVVHRPGSLDQVLSQHTGFDFLVATVTGHGDPGGIPVSNAETISPTRLLGAIRQCPGLRMAAVVLCQCFAGIFRYMDVRADPPICLLGAANLDESLSTLTDLEEELPTEDGSKGLKQWLANNFLVYFFEWLLSTRDVDGDGVVSLMDGYRYAGVSTNQKLRSSKVSLHAQVRHLHEEADRVRRDAPFDPRKALLADALEDQLRQSLLMLYLHQEPWVLNPFLGQKFQFSL